MSTCVSSKQGTENTVKSVKQKDNRLDLVCTGLILYAHVAFTMKIITTMIASVLCKQKTELYVQYLKN